MCVSRYAPPLLMEAVGEKPRPEVNTTADADADKPIKG